MSLVTRCPACGTMFKVVTDQLRVSQGWVRCGHCTDVFDAALHFQTTHNPAPDQSAARQPDTDVQAPSEAAVPSSTAVLQALPALQNVADSAGSAEADAVGAMSAEIEPPEPAQVGYTQPVSVLPSALPDEDVSFVRNSRRQAFWRRPVVRFVLGLSSLLLAVTLLVQFSVQQRHRLAAMEPQLKPWLLMLCEPLQCDIAPFRHIEAVVIDSSSFNKINTDVYRLSFSLKNTGTTPVAIPSLELTLTDNQDQALIRRVVTPAQFGVTQSNGLLTAGVEFSGVVVVQVLGTDPKSAVGMTPPAAMALRVAGYRVLAFYP